MTNKKILVSIKKRLDDAKGLWVEELLSMLWVIRIIVHSDTRDTPFNLTFGVDAFIFIKIGINTLQVRHFDPNGNVNSICTNLDLLEEVREESNIRVVARQGQLA